MNNISIVLLWLQTTTACDDGTQEINCHPGFTPCCDGEFDLLTCLLYFLTQHHSFITISALICYLHCVFMIGLVCQGHPPRCEAPTSSTSSTATTTVSVHPFIRWSFAWWMCGWDLPLSLIKYLKIYVTSSLDTNRALPRALKQHPLQPPQKQRPPLQAQQT